ncbi:MAG: hypothetical protein IPP79_24460 [Chitinophagaceae bacterium]|nr:hypothetical protein [Chitinophagaceae bacterium]
MNKLTIQIASVPDREGIVAEIWFLDLLVAEIYRNNEVLELEFYFNKNIAIDLNEFMTTLEIAKRKLSM